MADGRWPTGCLGICTLSAVGDSSGEGVGVVVAYGRVADEERAVPLAHRRGQGLCEVDEVSGGIDVPTYTEIGKEDRYRRQVQETGVQETGA